MRVKDIMTTKVVSVSPRTPIGEALDTMLHAHVSGLLVINESGSLIGVISEADFLRREELGTGRESGWLSAFLNPGGAAEIYARAHARRVDEIMSKNVAAVDEMDSLDDAVALMEKRRVKRLPVLRHGAVVGMLTRTDFVRSLALFLREPYDQAWVSDKQIKDRIDAEITAQSWAPKASLEVSVKNGLVTLEGFLTQDRERGAIHALVENVEGVTSINDRLVRV